MPAAPPPGPSLPLGAALGSYRGGIGDGSGRKAARDQSAEVRLPGNALDEETDCSIDGYQDPQLAGFPTAVPLDHQHCPEETEDRPRGTHHAYDGAVRGEEQESNGTAHGGQQVNGQEPDPPEQRLKGLSEDPQGVHVQHDVEKETLGVEERRRQHPPWLTVCKNVGKSELLVDSLAGQQPLQNVNQYA